MLWLYGGRQYAVRLTSGQSTSKTTMKSVYGIQPFSFLQQSSINQVFPLINRLFTSSSSSFSNDSGSTKQPETNDTKTETSSSDLTTVKRDAVEKRSRPVPVIYHPAPKVDSQIAKYEERYRKRYSVEPTEVLIYDNRKKCTLLRRLFWLFGIGGSVSMLNLYSVVFQNYTKYNKEDGMGPFIELITLYQKFPEGTPFHTQVFVFLETSLLFCLGVIIVHQMLNRQLARMFMDTDYGRFKAVFVEANKANERTMEFSYKDVTRTTHPLPHFENYIIKGTPYYMDQADFKHPKYYAYFRGAFEEILQKKV